MSYATKYRVEFKDYLGVLWRVDIEQDGFAGSITTLKATGSPLNFDFMSNSDRMLDSPIHGSTCELSVYAESDFAYIGMYNYGNMYYRMSVYWGGSYTLYWRGFVISDGYSEPYDCAPYPVTITASDGLGQLKNMLYKYKTTVEDDTYYNGRILESQIILDILGKIGYTAFTEFVNIYETRMVSTTTDSPFDQIKIDADLFKDVYCYDVLENILEKYNACIRQVAGTMVIYRPLEFYQTTVYGRIFSDATTKTGTTITPAQYIDRKTQVTDFRVPDGGTFAIHPPVKKLTVNQDYGYKISWLDNYDFHADTYDKTTGFANWTDTQNWSLPMANTYLTNDESNGVLLPAVTVVPNPIYFIEQTFGTYARSTEDVFVISFDYKIVKTTTGSITNRIIAIKVADKNNTYWLSITDDTVCNWGTSLAYITFVDTNTTTGAGEWQTFKRSFVGIPVSGEYTITLYPSNGVGIMIAFKNVFFASTADAATATRQKRKFKQRLRKNKWGYYFKLRNKYNYITEVEDKKEVAERLYELSNAIKGIDVDNDYILGDVLKLSDPASRYDVKIENIIEQYAGSLALYRAASLALAVERFILDYKWLYSQGDVRISQGTGIHINDIIFTAYPAGVNFTGATSIANASGTLNGTVANTQANVTGQSEIDQILLTGTSGKANVSCGGVTKEAKFRVDLPGTVADFVGYYYDDFFAAGVIISAAGESITFTGDNIALSPGAAISNTSGTLTGTKTDVQSFSPSTARIDTVTLTGSSGSANVTCDGKTYPVTWASDIQPSISWSNYGGSENKPLIELISEELKLKYSLPQQFLSVDILEKGYISTDPTFKLIANIQDNLNKVGGYNRIFVPNNATFDVKNRRWNVDMNEILMFRQPAYNYVNDTDNFEYTGTVTIAIGSTSMSYDFTFTDFTAGLRFTIEVYENGVFKNCADVDTGADPFHVTGTIIVSVCPYNMIYTIVLTGQ